MCAYLSGKNTLAIDDFLYASNSLDHNGFILSIYMLIVIGDIKDALGLLNTDYGKFENMGNDKEDQENEEVVCNEYENKLLKAHCYLLIEKYAECMEILGKFEMTTEIKNDIYMVDNLRKSKIKSKGSGVLFPKKYSIWFQAVDKFYKKDYDQAITLFEQTLELIQGNQIHILFQDNLIIEEEHCEILYNIGLANIMINTYDSLIKAFEIFSELSKAVEPNHSAKLNLLCSIIQILLCNKTAAEKYMQKVADALPEVCNSFIRNEKMTILPLNTGSQFSTKFRICQLPEYPNVMLRPAFRLPRLQPPLEIFDTYDLLLYLFEIESLSIRPEVPWLSKVKDNYKFTDVLLEDIEECISERKLHKGSLDCASQTIHRENTSFLLNDMSSKNCLQALVNKFQKCN
ncbi:hypothetical protein SteCoe_20783 [Stentor coeruleus]|uniref:Uncharacterized protein n=1 Tax=Stentor coeruleus TaxID=5963 RepID=A0A1R2BRA7_9CILI|nr:hypothetical protein SteCoe_20783 [Stentor coeruleus]